MKNHKLISFLLAVIIISLAVLIVSITAGTRSHAVSGALGNVYAVVEKPLSKVTGNISDSISGIFSYKRLLEENETLKEENDQLKEQITSLTLSANELKELKKLSEVLNFKGVSGTNDLVSADIITMDGTNWMNIFTINAGTESGIEEGDVVICGDGLVGRIDSVGKGWSKVVSLIDQSSKVTFKVSGNLELLGVVDEVSDGMLSGFMLDSKAKVAEGDKLITSGMGVYPAGIEIGKVTKVKYDSNAQLQRVTVKPSVEFTSLQKVSVMI